MYLILYFQDDGSSKVAGISVIFSDTALAPIRQYLSGKQVPKLTASVAEVQAVVLGLERAKTQGFLCVEIRTTSRLLEEIISKWLVIWKKNKWRRGNGGRLVIPVALLRRLDHLVTEMSVNVVKVNRGGSPEIVMAETLAKQCCRDTMTGDDLNPDEDLISEDAASSLNLSKQMERSIVTTFKRRLREQNKRKLKRKVLGKMRKKIQL